MLRAAPPRMPVWRRYWIVLIFFPASVAAIRAVLMHYFSPLTVELSVLALLITLTVAFIAWKKQNKKPVRLPNSSQRVGTSFPATGKVHGPNRLKLNIAELKCQKCGNPLGECKADLIKNIEELDEGGFAIKCPVCGTQSVLPELEGRELIKIRKKSEELILSATIMCAGGLVCGAGTVIAAVVCFDPGHYTPVIEWSVRIAGASIFFIGFVVTLFFVMQFIAIYKLIVGGNKSKS